MTVSDFNILKEYLKNEKELGGNLLGNKLDKETELLLGDIDNSSHYANMNIQSVIFNTEIYNLDVTEENKIIDKEGVFKLSEKNKKEVMKIIEATVNTPHVIYLRFSLCIVLEYRNVMTNRSFDKTSESELTMFSRFDNASSAVDRHVREAIDQLFGKDMGLASGIRLWASKRVQVKVVKYIPVGSGYIELPIILGTKRNYIMNIKPEHKHDKKCLAWCIIYTTKFKLLESNIKKYNKNKRLKMRINEVNQFYIELFYKMKLDSIEYPVSLMQIPSIEDNYNISINIWMLITDNKQWSLWKMFTSRKSLKKTVNLLYYQNHFMVIKDIDKLNKNNNNMYICFNCSLTFKRQTTYDCHSNLCLSKGKNVIYKLPEYKEIKFMNHQNKLPQYFVIYADFECIIKNNEHIPSGFYTKRICSNYKMETLDKYSKEYGYSGTDCVKKFIEYLEEEYFELTKLLKFKHINYNSVKYNKSDICWVCDEYIKNDSVIEHCHLTGDIRGTAHNESIYYICISWIKSI